MLHSTADLSRVIEMAWEDHIPFEAIFREYGLTEAAVIRVMRQQLKPIDRFYPHQDQRVE